MIRLSKVMAQRGLCSRREADRYIAAGLVCVDGEVISELGTKVSEEAQIELLPEAQQQQSRKVTILLHKPIGVMSTQPEKGYTEAKQLITPDRQWGKTRRRFHPAHTRKLAVCGRLDSDSTGLLLLTQDGTLARQIVGEDSEFDKEYLVRVAGEVTPARLAKLREGLELDGVPLKRAGVEELEPGLLRFILREGKKRQIRRMCELVELRVLQLKRVRIGPYKLQNLPSGCWCYSTLLTK